MRVGVPKETAEGERRVALTPDVVKRLAAKKVSVVVESGAGITSSIHDARTRSTSTIATWSG